MNPFHRKLLRFFTVLYPIIWFTGIVVMLVNMGLITISSFMSTNDEGILYDGEYISFFDDNQGKVFDNRDIRVTRIDKRTGYPAATDLTVYDTNGVKIACTNVVNFTYQGAPALLRFANGKAVGFAYQKAIFKYGSNIESQWDTNPDLLKAAVEEYSLQVSAILNK